MIFLEGVLFDFDGVIVDTEPIHDRLSRELLAGLDVHPPTSFFDRLRGLRADDEWHLIATELGLGIPTAELVRRAETVRSLELMNGPPPPAIPGARRLVESLAGRALPIAVVSSSPTHRVRAVLDRLALADSVGVIVGGDSVARGKPFPDGYRAAADSLGIEPRRCVVIEDSHRGVEAGVAAGAVCVHVTTAPPHAGAAIAVEDLTSLDVDGLRDLVSQRG